MISLPIVSEISKNCGGIKLDETITSTRITNNDIYDNYYGICIDSQQGSNSIQRNNFHNIINAFTKGDDIWDYGYPFGGNYWHDYMGVDIIAVWEITQHNVPELQRHVEAIMTGLENGS